MSTVGLVPGNVVADKEDMQGVHLRGFARRAAAVALDFALPPRCAGCGSIVGDPHRFCLECWRAIRFLGEPCCERCGLPFAFDAGGAAQCAACLAEPPRFDRLRAAVAYGELARRVALRLKYGRKPAVAETLARLMHRHMRGIEDSLLVPVPLHRWRLWSRGYNQSALIAKSLARRTGQKVALDLIERHKATPSLRGLGRRARARAVRGAFRIRDDRRALVAGQSITLVDDVYTSGATANACASALKRAGAARVNIICWARVVSDDDR